MNKFREIFLLFEEDGNGHEVGIISFSKLLCMSQVCLFYVCMYVFGGFRFAGIYYVPKMAK